MKIMSATATPDERLAQFQRLYREVLNAEFDPEEFVSDVLYAFTILETAAHSQSESLRHLAAHLQIDLGLGFETINIRPLESESALVTTRKMPTLAAGATHEESRPLTVAEHVEPQAGDRRQPGRGERRQSTTVLTPEMAKMIERLLRFYGAEFGKPFDLEEFLTNDLYGRAVLKKAQGSSNPELLATAQFFLDEDGRPRRHRRRGEERTGSAADRRSPP
ncbi:MAG: hypothetical protein JWN73_2840 [Betaproteobacteria bacterium]|nr:hypothetical protein [Betaproteobacteria bacterium]